MKHYLGAIIGKIGRKLTKVAQVVTDTKAAVSEVSQASNPDFTTSLL
jgi:hypothetical protein